MSNGESVVIIGNGPAGMLAAVGLRELDPLLIAPANQPEPSACGGVLTAPATDFLRREDLLDPLVSAGGRWLRQIELHSGGERLLIHTVKQGRMVAFRRTQFDRTLWSLLEVNQTRTRTDYVRGVKTRRDAITLTCRSEDSLPAQGIIDASGHRQITGAGPSGTGSLVGTEWTVPTKLEKEQSLCLVLGNGWYAGISSPPGPKVVVSAVARHNRYQQLNHSGLWTQILLGLSEPTAGRFPNPPPEEPLTKAGFWHEKPPSNSNRRTIRIGDALGFTMPLSGEGIAMAMREGARAGRVLRAEHDRTGTVFPLSRRARRELFERLVLPFRKQIPRWKRTHWLGMNGSIVRSIQRLSPMLFEHLFTGHVPSESDWAPSLSRQ